MKRIKFLKSHTPYNVNEVAGFAPNVARKLVDQGIAEFIEPEDAPSQNKAITDQADKTDTKTTSKKSK